MDILDVAKSFAKTVKKSAPTAEHPAPLKKSEESTRFFDLAEPAPLSNEPSKSNPQSWSKEDQALIDWFSSAKDLPTAPFLLKQAVYVEAPEKFYSWLCNDIQQGPSGARARFGTLQGDLRTLQRLIKGGNP